MSVRATTSGVRLVLHVRPGAAVSELAGRHGDAIAVRLAAPPVDGRANDALIEYLARVLEVPRRAVTIVSGVSARRKVVDVDGVEVRDAARRLGAE